MKACCMHELAFSEDISYSIIKKEDRRMTEQVWNYVCENHMLTEKDRVVAGISGGADSVCLLLLLLEFQKRLPFELCAVHVDHGIRGEEARKDAEFTRRLCLERQRKNAL